MTHWIVALWLGGLSVFAITPDARAVMPGPVATPGDADGDGVPDAVDECPNTPRGAKVLPDGCLPRNDCRRARKGEAAEANGCAIEHTYILRGVNFEFDSAKLTASAEDTLKTVAEVLEKYPELKFEVHGHTCNMGSAAYNQGLSDRRARSVKAFLVAQGVGADRIKAFGHGLAQPIDTNLTRKGRETNRRVELKVVE